MTEKAAPCNPVEIGGDDEEKIHRCMTPFWEYVASEGCPRTMPPTHEPVW